MCVGLPARVLRVVGDEAYVDTGHDRRRKVSVAVPEGVRRGDFVVLFGDVAVGKTSRRVAIQSLRYMKEMATMAAVEDGTAPDATALSFDSRIRRLAHRPRARLTSEGPNPRRAC